MTIWATLAYAGAAAIAILLLFAFRSLTWYWHVGSLVLATLVACVPYTQLGISDGPVVDLIIGSVILFLLVWGLGGLLFRPFEHHGQHKHA